MYKLSFLIFLGLFSCKSISQPMETVSFVDLEKYAGLWYETALYPNSFEKDCSCTTAEYQLSGKKYIRVINSCQRNNKLSRAKGKAFVVKGSGNAKLKVQFFWPFRGDYWILGLADDYSWALVGSPDKKYLWILSRSPEMDNATYDHVVSIAEAKGFDGSRLVKTKHGCE